jgi:hypothetical protein
LVERRIGRDETREADELAGRAQHHCPVAIRRLAELSQDDRVQLTVAKIALGGGLGVGLIDLQHGKKRGEVAVGEGPDPEALGVEWRHLHVLGPICRSVFAELVKRRPIISAASSGRPGVGLGRCRTSAVD